MGTYDSERRAPLVDSFFIDPLRAAWGVGAWLRQLELDARDLIAAIAHAEREGNPTKLLREVSERLAEFVEGERGTLHRLLHRQLRQLRANEPPRLSADRTAEQLFATARTVLAIHPGVLVLQRKLADLGGRFSPTLPHILADHIQAAEIGETALLEVRTFADVMRLDQRMARVTSVLQDVEESANASAMQAGAEAAEIDPAIPVTMIELLGYRESTLRSRTSQATGNRTLRMSANVTAVTALAIVDAQAEAVSAGPSLVAPVVERQAVTALGRWKDGPDSEATSFMSGVLGAGANGLLPNAGRFVWTPPIGSFRLAVPELASQPIREQSDDSTFYSIPIGKDFVLFSRAIRSVVRLYSRTLEIGEVVECTARPIGEQDTPPSNAADRDLQRQFVGLDPFVSCWYRTSQRAKVRVIAHCGDEWYGRIEKQGELERLAGPGASDRSPAVGSFRVLREPIPSTRLDESSSPVEAMVTGSPRVFMGLRSIAVNTPFSEHRRGLVRSFSGRSQKGVEAVRRELALLTQLDQTRKIRRIPGISSVAPLGAVSLPRPRGTGRILFWPCYTMPLAGWEPEYDRSWIQADVESTLAMLASVARTVCVVNDLGFSVGAMGFQSLAIGIGWRTPNCNPIPQPALVSAPLACPFGGKYYDPSDPDSPPEKHHHIRVSLVCPEVERGKRAHQAVDVRGFGMFALDLLVRNPAAVDHTETSIVDAAARGDLQFTFPLVAERLLLALSAPDCEERLLRGMKVLADPKSDLNDWINSLNAD